MADEEQKTNGELKPQRPEYISEKFWNTDTNEVNLEDLASSYNSLEKKLGSRTEELSKQIRQDIEQERIANTPKEYELFQPEVPEGVSIEVNKDIPLLQWWEETARKKGLSQEEYNDGIKKFVDNQIAALPVLEEEKQQLGENATQRIEAADLWAKKNLSSDAYSAASNLASTAAGVKVIEELMKLTKDAPMPTTETAIEAAPSLEDLRSMMQDPRYWKDGQRDPAYINKVAALFEKYYGKGESEKG
jgi:hypothetical protein|tara:strand:+ start:868 stop:1608 length:741 start_codon:yes stop_codon:yes gene_type:complete